MNASEGYLFHSVVSLYKKNKIYIYIIFIYPAYIYMSSVRFVRLGSSYTPNYVTASRIDSFCRNNGGCATQQTTPPPPPPPSSVLIPNLNISMNSEYPINLSYVLNNDNSVTFSGYINKSNFSVNNIEIFPENSSYSVSYTFNSVTGGISFSIQNYSNSSNISIFINGTTQLASTTHYITFYNYHVINSAES